MSTMTHPQGRSERAPMNSFIQSLRWTNHKPFQLLPRILAGGPLLGLGLLHFVRPDNFRNILIASEVPMVELNMIAAPAAEVVAGVLLLLGFYARIGGLLGVATMVPAIYATGLVQKLDPATLPGGLKEIPFVPPIALPAIVLLSSLVILWFGAGKPSMDRSATAGLTK